MNYKINFGIAQMLHRQVTQGLDSGALKMQRMQSLAEKTSNRLNKRVTFLPRNEKVSSLKRLQTHEEEEMDFANMDVRMHRVATTPSLSQAMLLNKQAAGIPFDSNRRRSLKK